MSAPLSTLLGALLSGSLSGLLSGCASLPPTRSVEVNGQRTAFVQAGGSPPVAVFQAGLGDGKAVWAGVIEQVTPGLAVFAHDRPGYGDSSAEPAGPRDPCTLARELHATLQAAGVKPPFLLVGHSIGGLYQLAFAHLYPQEVAGLLLVDPTHPDHWARMQREAPAAARLATGLRATVFSRTMRAEFDAQAQPACIAELQALPPLAVPARLLVRSDFSLAERGDFEALVRQLELAWAAWVPGISRRQVAGAGHYIQKDQPGVVAEELQALARAARKAEATPR
ncbi:alpha/beta fold hydrolase [Roseateles sp. BYS87W]|uniref:Alpha/beta fold hydrolase n=1 Tax=Pelomonas baiyunensis TaxID=3299026 RepID=A0ABW7H2X6_9BURK